MNNNGHYGKSDKNRVCNKAQKRKVNKRLRKQRDALWRRYLQKSPQTKR